MSFTTIEDHDILTKQTMVPFRGLFPQVQHLNNSPEAIINHCNLDWAGIKMPLGILGKTQIRPYGGNGAGAKFAIVNGKTGEQIDGGKPVSAAFKLPQNKVIIEDMCRAAKDNGLVMAHCGVIDNGRLVVGHATHSDLLNINPVDKGYALHQGDLSRGEQNDVVEAGVILTASYESGIKSRIRPYANRFVCTNGVIIVAKEFDNTDYSFGHTGEGYQRRQLEGIFERFGKDFRNYCVRLQELGRIDATKPTQMAYLMELTQGNLFDELVKATHEKLGAKLEGHMQIQRAFYLDSVNSNDAVERELLSVYQEKASRTLRELVELNTHQPGVEFVNGTIAQPYHALTHWVDHRRGHSTNPGAAVEASLFGAGNKLKLEALEVATQYAEWTVRQ